MRFIAAAALILTTSRCLAFQFSPPSLPPRSQHQRSFTVASIKHGMTKSAENESMLDEAKVNGDIHVKDQEAALEQVEDEDEEDEEENDIDPQVLIDEEHMAKAVNLALSNGGERGPESAYPNPTCAAVLVSKDGQVISDGRSDYRTDCVQACLEGAGLEITPLHEWCVKWPSSKQLRKDLKEATLYLTLEPSASRKGQAFPPITQLIGLSGIRRVVIGSPDPVPELASKGAAALHMAGINCVMGSILTEECDSLIEEYAAKANGKLARMARKHFKQFKKPLGFLHCSVVDSLDVEAYARHGNAFGRQIGGKTLSYRNLGAYEIAPPPETIWAKTNPDEEDEDIDFAEDVDDIFNLEFEDEDFQEGLDGSPMMPWYEQVDAVVATFPKPGNGPDDSIESRLSGLKWLATYGNNLPAGVERILVMDATDLADLPMTNDDENVPHGVDIESFWKAEGRKATRVLLRRGDSAQAQAAAKAAAKAAEGAAKAALAAKEAIETGDAEAAAEAALECQEAATAAAEYAQNELLSALELKQRLLKMGVVVETISGGEPVDVMKHLGARNGYQSCVWRAGCWGNRGVQSILAGAFQWVSAHLAVDAKGGKFWQLMLAERAVQAACGPESKVKVFAGDADISLEYCDEPDADSDCTLTVGGRPIRHVRLDCRVALVDPSRSREFAQFKTKPFDRTFVEEEAPWFL